jgi:hypothetical protein
MARTIQSTQAQVIRELLDGDTTPSRLTPAVAVALSNLGALELKSGRLAVTDKAKRLLSRNEKRAAQLKCDSEVARVLQNEILTEKGIITQHRQVWEAVGQKEFTRAQVLNSLRSLRAVGFLKSFKPSGNNFQVFWSRKSDLESWEVADFEVNE